MLQSRELAYPSRSHFARLRDLVLLCVSASKRNTIEAYSLCKCLHQKAYLRHQDAFVMRTSRVRLVPGSGGKQLCIEVFFPVS